MMMFQKIKPENHLYAGQEIVQPILVILMLIAIPTMLLPKPLVLARLYHQKQLSHHSNSADFHHRDNEALTLMEDEEEEEEFDFAEVFIHQMIESIEFILGTISNTASYLRLWALSLAHQQLASVFFQQTILNAFKAKNIVVMTLMLFFAYFVFAMATLGILLLMDSLECFLHALRLHWVEFQNKFYKAGGYPFSPLDFKEALSGVKDEA